MYKPGGTIADALKHIQNKNYVLPAIQREFVWKPEQIERLFDSLMQGYPVGTFLFWKVEPATSGKFKFYDFVRNYHQRDAAHCPELGVIHDQSLIAVLDGQQRLTALNIGLRGSMAIKQPNKWWSSSDAFPKRTLRLDLGGQGLANEDGVLYRFRFLDDAQVARDESTVWFSVPEIVAMSDGPAMLTYLQKRGLKDEALSRAYATLDCLHRVVHTKNLLNYYEEESQDIERVLNIFIRLNSGGTVLSYSDLLLSIAIAQWKKLDARSEIHGLVDELNRVGVGFNFSHDFVLKAGLMLANIASVGFKVENFTTENMEELESNWPSIRSALMRTVELAGSFGLNGQTLRADSALLPISHYLYRRQADSSFVTHSRHSKDREAIRGWLIRSLLKPSGVWGSGLDTLLTSLRDVIRQHGKEAFPVAELGYAMAQRGKTLVFEEPEIEDLLHMQYGDKRMFALMSLLFPFVDLRNQFHMDHIFPISRFSSGKLKKMGFGAEEAASMANHANQLPNLQLLEGTANNEKRASMPLEWLGKAFKDQATRNNYCELHALGMVPETMQAFEGFHKARRDRLRERLTALLVEKDISVEPGKVAAEVQ